MSIYINEATTDLPEIVLDKRTGTFEIKGTSFPEDAQEFYQPVLSWIDKFAEDPLPEFCLIFQLIYYNTSTSKVIQTIFEKFEIIYGKGVKISVKWYYDSEDEDMYEGGLGYKERIEMPFSLIEM